MVLIENVFPAVIRLAVWKLNVPVPPGGMPYEVVMFALGARTKEHGQRWMPQIESSRSRRPCSRRSRSHSY